MDDATSPPLEDHGRPTVSGAAAALRDADRLAGRTRRHARWWVRFMACYAVGFGALTLLVGAADGPGELVAPFVGFAAMTAGLLLWSRSQQVRGGVPRRLFLPGWLGTSVAYGVAVWAGLLLSAPLWAWVVAAVVVALPLALASVRAHRALR